MMKNQTFQIFRKDFSTYQKSNFKDLEKSALESISSNITYTTDPSEELPTILITNSQSKIDSIKINPDKIVLHIHPNSGYDNLPYKYIKNAKYPIVIGSPIRKQAVSNYAIACIFKHLTDFSHSNIWDPLRLWSHDLLSEKKLLLIGKGHIGTIIFDSLKPLLKDIHIYDPFKDHLNLGEIDSFDIVILTPTLNKSSYHIINESFLNKCKANIVIINPARGKLIDQSALISFLKNNPKSFAYLDVFENEPFKTEFNCLSNVSTTPHIAGVFNGLDRQILDFNKQTIEDFFNLNPLNFNELYKPLLLKNRLRDSFVI